LGHSNVTATMSTPMQRFSATEIMHILIAYAVLTFDFWLIVSGINFFAGGQSANMFGVSFTIMGAIPVAAAVTATGFVSHEMAHKFEAQRMGLWAEFRMYPQWLVLSIIFSFIGFLFAAPGATFVGGWGSKKEAGLTSIAGPLLNLGWAALFLGMMGFILGFHLRFWNWEYIAAVFFTVAIVNMFFAVFNLIPFGPLDGKKVYNWDKRIWVVSFIAAVAVYIFFAYIIQITI